MVVIREDSRASGPQELEFALPLLEIGLPGRTAS